MAAVGRLWRGELALDSAFWNWAVLGGLAVNLSSSAAFLWLVTIDRPVLALIAGYVPSLPYNLAVVVGVWRAAEGYEGDPKHAELARLVTLVGMVLLSIT